MRNLPALVFLFSALVAHADELPYKDQDFGCTAAADADRYFSDFNVDLDSFSGRELCNPTVDTKMLLNDLTIIEKTKFAAEVKHPFVRGYVAKDDYYNWMKGETRGVARGHDIPYATAYNSGGYFTMQDGWKALSTLGRVGTIIHEARHTEGYRHYRCETGPYASSWVSGCDTSYSQGGSHAVEMEYYARVVLEAQNLNPVYKSMARLMALGRSNFVFNEQPMKTREALLAKSAGKVTLVDGSKVVDRDLPQGIDASAKLKRSSFGATLVVNRTEAYALDLYDNATSKVAKSDDYSYFKMFKMEKDKLPEPVKAMEELDVGNLRFFTALTENGSFYNYNFGEGHWYDSVRAPADATDLVTTTPSGKRGLFAVKKDGSLFAFNFSRQRFETNATEMWPAAASAYAFAGTRLVKLGSDGRIVDANSGESFSSLPGQYTDLVNVPLYDAFEVVP